MSRPTDILGARSPMLQQMSGMPEQVTVPPASRRPSPDSDSDEDDDGDDDQTFVASTSGSQSTPSTGSSAPAKAPPITSSASRKARKKRERACDWCRHRKIKCDGAIRGGVCSLCERQNVGCTYVSKSKRRKVPDRGEHTPNAKVPQKSASLPPALADDGGSRSTTASNEAVADSHMITLAHDEIDASAGQSPFSSGSSPGPKVRRPASFMGKSSTMSLVVETHALVEQQKPPSSATMPSSEPEKKPALGQRQPWEVETYIDVLKLVDCWPAPDLAAVLVETYFRATNTVLPLLDEDNFKCRLASSDYLTDRTFASLCLMVFALAARDHINDPRTWAPSMSLDPYGPATFDRWSAGWQYYHQATRQTRHRTKPADLWDLQLSVLSSMFLGGLVSWTLIGEGLIFAQEMGAHRSGQVLSPDPLEEASVRRAFWVLFCLDAVTSTQIGRSYHIATSTINAPLPDEASDHPAPEASKAFRLIIDISKLLKTVGESLYSLDSAARNRPWLVLQMKSLHTEADALQQQIPPSLRWSSSMPDERVFYAATCVQVMLQQLLLLVHRPSLPTRGQAAGPPLSPSSFDAAVSAALRTSYIVQALDKRDHLNVSFIGAAVTEAAGTLGIALLGANQAGLVVDEESLTQGLLRCRESVASGCEHPLAVGWMDDILELKSPAGRPEPPSRLPSAFLLHFGPTDLAAPAPPPPLHPSSTSASTTGAPLDFAFTPFSYDSNGPTGATGNPFSLEDLGIGVLDPSVRRST